MQQKKDKKPQKYMLDAHSTREVILEKSLELINAGGMVDFRIDALATALNLSPGNITYHFSRKEDICVTLWEKYLEEYKDVERAITTLLDLKQVYLIDRLVMQLNFKYRGVLIFRSADLGATTRDFQTGRENFDMHMSYVYRVLNILETNGFINKCETENPLLNDLIRQYHYMLMRWGVNFGYLLYSADQVEKHLDHLALLCVHVIYPILTPKGVKEFHEIAEIVESGKLVSTLA